MKKVAEQYRHFRKAPFTKRIPQTPYPRARNSFTSCLVMPRAKTILLCISSSEECSVNSLISYGSSCLPRSGPCSENRGRLFVHLNPACFDPQHTSHPFQVYFGCNSTGNSGGAIMGIALVWAPGDLSFIFRFFKRTNLYLCELKH